MTKPRIKLPESAKVGEVIEIKTLISHVMETGQRKGRTASLIPRSIINTFTAKFAGTEVFKAELHPGISANPYLSFFMKVPGPGRVRVHLDRGRRQADRREGEAQRGLTGVRPGGSDTHAHAREVERMSDEPICAQKGPYQVTLEAGKAYFWCTLRALGQAAVLRRVAQDDEPAAAPLRCRKLGHLQPVRLQEHRRQAVLRRHPQRHLTRKLDIAAFRAHRPRAQPAPLARVVGARMPLLA